MSNSELVPLLDIVIPVKDRTTVERCVSILIAQMAQVKGLRLGRILLCDGGSQSVDCRKQLETASLLPKVEVLLLPHEGFNKGWLINRGLQAARAPVVIVSDVDILWQAKTLETMGTSAAAHPSNLYHVQDVQESEPDNVATGRSRYTYQLTQSENETIVELYAASPPGKLRPGYGLICAQLALLQQIGGYRHAFQGWGWEDQDLLMRAQLLGYKVRAMGTVEHLSHGDAGRNAFAGQQSPQESRDRNIRICLTGLAKGNLQGDLPLASVTTDRFMKDIQIHCPPELEPCT
jgi:glycosyltransferase involved in cell wall biosynthesis